MGIERQPISRRLELLPTSHLQRIRDTTQRELGKRIQAHPEKSKEFITRRRVFDSGIGDLFSDEHRGQCRLDVWAALAVAQAEYGIIPHEAAVSITEKAADITKLDVKRMLEINDEKSHKIMGPLEVLSEAVGEPYGGMIHTGVTAENIHRTGDMLVLREASEIILGLMGDTFGDLEVLALEGKDMVCAGRTHGQHATPETFGFKVAGWVAELADNANNLIREGPDLFTAMMGGPVGNFASMGEKGPKVQDRVAELLNLKSMVVPSRANNSEQLNYVLRLLPIASTYGKIAGELDMLMQTEFGEVCEPIPPGVVGSSAMPQKRNPQLLDDCIALTQRIFSLAPLALNSTLHTHEVSGAHTSMMDAAVENVSILTGMLLTRMHIILSGLTLNEERMKSNLKLTKGLLKAATVMDRIAKNDTGDTRRAHGLVYLAAQAAQIYDQPFIELLLADPEIAKNLTAEELSYLLDPESDLGLSIPMAQNAATTAHALAAKLSNFHF